MSAARDSQGRPLALYRGDNGGERLGAFRVVEVDEGGSGGLFFTDNPTVASNYAKGKTWRPHDLWDVLRHVLVGDGGNQPLRPLADLLREQGGSRWPAEGRAGVQARLRIRQAVLDVGYDDEGDLIWQAEDRVISPEVWTRYQAEHPGHPLLAATEALLISGLLNMDEFVGWLRHLDLVPRLFFDDPRVDSPVVTRVHLDIRHPLDPARLSDADLDALAQRAGQEDRTILSLRRARREHDPEVITALTPEFRAAAEALGYDGITEAGGEIGDGVRHRVWIAFRPEQVIPYGQALPLEAEPDLPIP